jgi:hypothetical protein
MTQYIAKNGAQKTPNWGGPYIFDEFMQNLSLMIKAMRAD